jgi:beta-galactosidase
MPCAVPEGAGEVHLTVEFALRRDTWFASAGHVVAVDQVEVRAARPRRAGRFTPNHLAAAVDEVLEAPVALEVFRATTDNDGFKLLPELSLRHKIGGDAWQRWTEAGLHQRPADEFAEHTWSRAASPDGSVEYRHQVDVPEALADLARVGVSFALPARFSVMRWFGRGPHENYPDRRSGAALGIYEGPLDESPYLVPQEFGLRTDCRWFELLDPGSGQRVRVDVLQSAVMHCSATHYRSADLFAATTHTDLVPRPEVIVHLDVAHRGLGTASCGPDVLPQYRLSAGRYRFAYRLSVH